jgi:hypothetical protein
MSVAAKGAAENEMPSISWLLRAPPSTARPFRCRTGLRCRTSTFDTGVFDDGRYFDVFVEYAKDPHFKDLELFYRYFHGEDGRGLGASYQTGWTALAANLLERVASVREVAGAPLAPADAFVAGLQSAV